MSTILKALQRLEDDKAPKPEMTLDDQVIAGGGPPKPPRRSWLGLVAGALAGVAVAGAAVFFWPSGSDEAPVEVAAENAPAAQTPSAAVGQIPAAMRGTPEAADKPNSPIPGMPTRVARAPREMAGPQYAQEIEVVERIARREPAMMADEDPVENEPVRPERVNTRPGARPKESRAAALAAVAKRNAKRADTEAEKARRGAEAQGVLAAATPSRPGALLPKPKAKAAPEKPAVAEIPKPPAEPVVVAAAKPAQPRAEPKASSPPRPAAAKTERPKANTNEAGRSGEAVQPTASKKIVRRAAVPELRVRRTVWHPDGSRRIAFVELVEDEQTLELREGDAVGPLVIETIKPTGVQFAHDGVAIHHAVSND